MDDNELFELAEDHVARENYHAAVSALQNISDLDFKVKKTHFLLSATAMNYAARKFGKVTITQDRKKYERIKNRQGEIPREAVLYRNKDDIILS